MSATSIATTVIPDDGVLTGVCARAQEAETLERFSAQGARCGWCSHPIRLVGSQTTVDRSTGEILRTYSTASELDGVLLKACGTRRATRCPSCAATYGADARMLVRSGLSGGKGVPATVSDHPLVFATFTAPSFGAVHGIRSKGGSHPCRPGVRGRRCAHGRPVACWTRHGINDPGLGEPLCPDCYDYEAAVLWNAACPELWRRTTIYVKRELARLCGTNAKGLRKHLHAVIRLDAADDDCTMPAVLYQALTTLPSSTNLLDSALLTTAIQTAAPRSQHPSPPGSPTMPGGATRSMFVSSPTEPNTKQSVHKATVVRSRY